MGSKAIFTYICIYIYIHIIYPYIFLAYKYLGSLSWGLPPPAPRSFLLRQRPWRPPHPPGAPVGSVNRRGGSGARRDGNDGHFSWEYHRNITGISQGDSWVLGDQLMGSTISSYSSWILEVGNIPNIPQSKPKWAIYH